MNLIDRDGSRDELDSSSTRVVRAGQEMPKGRVVEWDDERGFGWVERELMVADGTKRDRVFAHIKEFPKGLRPQVGDEVFFSVGRDAQGRSCAKSLTFVNRKMNCRSVGAGSWGWLAVLLALPIGAGLKLPVYTWLVPGWMGLMSVVAWFTYRSDKKAAVNGEWRIQESRLHLLELLGGWPGAFLAQRVFRHKSAKVSYRVIFWGIVLLYQVVALDVVTDNRMSAELWSALQVWMGVLGLI